MVLCLAGGCGKQESSSTRAGGNASRSPSPVAAEKPPAVEVPNAAISQATVSSNPVPVATPSPAVAMTNAGTNLASLSPNPTNIPVPSQTPQPVTNPMVSAVSSALTSAATGVLASNLQASLVAQRLALTQTGTNQFQALAAAATNRILAALAMTNQAVSMTTNQVQVLLDRARNLTANQKYQDALDTVIQLYNTKLTPDQKQKVDALKNQIQTALAQKAAAEATSTLGGFFQGKKP